MPEISLLDQETIDKIAAGEVIERPSSVVKELVENSMDAGASAVTVEIKDGGLSLIRITDNGCGIDKSQVPIAFLRHSTSKIKSVEDLLTVSSLGFRGEALSSIAAVSQVELITKTAPALTGVRYVIEGSEEKEIEEVGAPDGTTFLVRNLFYNTPVRRKFLKTAQTEAGYIHALIERLALSRPDISFKLIVNNQPKLHTSGNSNVKDVIFQIYGREIASSLIEINESGELFSISGFLGKPVISRGNRNLENYFINNRYIKSSLIAKGIEDAYKNFLMQRQYPFCALYFSFDGQMLDVNVHPSKMELRFVQSEGIYQYLVTGIREKLMQKDHIKSVSLGNPDNKAKAPVISKKELPEPFEKSRYPKRQPVFENSNTSETGPVLPAAGNDRETFASGKTGVSPVLQAETDKKERGRQNVTYNMPESRPAYVQEELAFEERFLSGQAKKMHKIIGQAFDTYWLVEYKDELFIIDQHAAHEKALYERTIRSLKNKEYTTQLVSPPMILELDRRQEEALALCMEQLLALGFEIEPFGGREYAVCGVPGNLFGLDARQILMEVLDGFGEISKSAAPETVLEKIASMSCKAAVKGNNALSREEIEALIDELLELENPYFCPHGRPTIISMSKQELEKKFKRIV